jgi:Fe2+ or Zn2+ uptake regulation protein
MTSHTEVLENKPIRTRLLATEVVRAWFEKNTHVGRYVTIEDAYHHLRNNENIVNIQQVRDSIKSWYKHGLLSRIRIGLPYAYWFTANATHPTQVKAGLPVAETTAPQPTHIPKPEIIVQRNQIIIQHAKCKITVEFDE